MTAAPSDGPEALPPSPPAGAAGPGAGSAPPAADRRSESERRGAERRVKQVPVAHERRSGTDRRRDAERRAAGSVPESDEDLLEFLRAIHDFKERTGKAFPAWSDVLRIVRELGYEKRA